MTINITNQSQLPIEVAINRYGKEGDTDYFTIAAFGDNSWNRSDSRGYIMSVKNGGAETPYFVRFDSGITFQRKDGTLVVKDGDMEIKPVNQ